MKSLNLNSFQQTLHLFHAAIMLDVGTANKRANSAGFAASAAVGYGQEPDPSGGDLTVSLSRPLDPHIECGVLKLLQLESEHQNVFSLT
jgi:hypothetical protein